MLVVPYLVYLLNDVIQELWFFRVHFLVFLEYFLEFFFSVRQLLDVHRAEGDQNILKVIKLEFLVELKLQVLD